MVSKGTVLKNIVIYVVIKLFNIFKGECQEYVRFNFVVFTINQVACVSLLFVIIPGLRVTFKNVCGQIYAVDSWHLTIILRRIYSIYLFGLYEVLIH